MCALAFGVACLSGAPTEAASAAEENIGSTLLVGTEPQGPAIATRQRGTMLTDAVRLFRGGAPRARALRALPGLLEGLRYAVAQGARIVNMSVNGPDRSRALEEAVAEAARQGVTIVTSAGNDGSDRDLLPSYPASIDSDALLTVAASDASGSLAHGSAYGAVSVDLSAPGENVLTTVPGGRYGLYSGTSFAAAHVTGALALLAAARPDADAPTLRAALLAGARRGTPLADQVVAGELNAGRAMRALVPRRG